MIEGKILNKTQANYSMRDECPSVNIRQPLQDFESLLKYLLRYRIADGDIELEDYKLSKEDLLISYRLFIIDYITETGDPAYNMRILKWQNY